MIKIALRGRPFLVVLNVVNGFLVDFTTSEALMRGYASLLLFFLIKLLFTTSPG
jgi:hypothetical protein